jgi:hypothetical protein
MDDAGRTAACSNVIPQDQKSSRCRGHNIMEPMFGALDTQGRVEVDDRPPRGIKMFCSFRSTCTTPCWCMKLTASKSCLATDYMCVSWSSSPVSHPPATGIDMTLPPSTRTPAMVWFSGELTLEVLQDFNFLMPFFQKLQVSLLRLMNNVRH